MPAQNALLDGRDFKLGLFSPNCAGRLAVTSVPERWSASWADNVRLAKLADEVGIEIERIAKAGLAGISLSFVDYISELDYFASEVIPRPERKGIPPADVTGGRLCCSPRLKWHFGDSISGAGSVGQRGRINV